MNQQFICTLTICFVLLLILQFYNSFYIVEGNTNMKREIQSIDDIDAEEEEIEVPQLDMAYTSSNGPGQTPNDQMAKNTKISTQAKENSKFDEEAFK